MFVHPLPRSSAPTAEGMQPERPILRRERIAASPHPSYTSTMPIDPATLFVRIYPDPVLRKKASEVLEVTDEINAVAKRMIDLMHESDGIGLAAPQVGLPWRLFVASVPPIEECGRSLGDDPMTALAEPTVYLNPTLRDFAGDLETYEEGCLSLPDLHGDLRRPLVVTIEATGLDGKRFTQRGQGLLARCWQHEHDHLEGVLIIDRMTPMSRIKNRSKIREFEKQYEPLESS